MALPCEKAAFAHRWGRARMDSSDQKWPRAVVRKGLHLWEDKADKVVLKMVKASRAILREVRAAVL